MGYFRCGTSNFGNVTVVCLNNTAKAGKQSIDVTAYPGYQNFTTDNFFIKPVQHYLSTNNTSTSGKTVNLSITYNPTTGIAVFPAISMDRSSNKSYVTYRPYLIY